MSVIDVLVPQDTVRRLHVAVAGRLSRLGHDVALVGVDASGMAPVLENILHFERTALRVRLNSLLDTVPEPKLSPARRRRAC